LTDKEFSQEEVEAIVEKLLSYGYINDLEYAKLFVESYKKRCGLRLMSFKLGEKGVASEIVLQVLPKSDEEAAVMLAKKYIKESTTWQKLSNYLGGKGFSSDGIRAACRLLEER
jgi:regulatory protein